MNPREFLRNVGKLGTKVRWPLVGPMDGGQLLRHCQLSLQSNSQDCCAFCRVPYEPIGFTAQALLRGGDLPSQYEQ
jgi:hypothetical protein